LANINKSLDGARYLTGFAHTRGKPCVSIQNQHAGNKQLRYELAAKYSLIHEALHDKSSENLSKIWWVLIGEWLQISLNSPNFLPAKLSRYMVLF